MWSTIRWYNDRHVKMSKPPEKYPVAIGIRRGHHVVSYASVWIDCYYYSEPDPNAMWQYLCQRGNGYYKRETHSVWHRLPECTPNCTNCARMQIYRSMYIRRRGALSELLSASDAEPHTDHPTTITCVRIIPCHPLPRIRSHCIYSHLSVHWRPLD